MGKEADNDHKGEEIRPCPFCGGVGKVRSVTGLYYVSCMACGGRGGEWYKKNEAIRNWNRRNEAYCDETGKEDQ